MVVDVPYRNRDSLQRFVGQIVSAELEAAEPREKAQELFARLAGLGADPNSADELRLNRGLTSYAVARIAVVDYSSRYYINSSKSLGNRTVATELGADGTLSKAEAAVGGDLEAITAAFKNIAEPVGPILTGIGAVRGSGAPAIAGGPTVPGPVVYRLKVNAVAMTLLEVHSWIDDTPDAVVATMPNTASQSLRWITIDSPGKDDGADMPRIRIEGALTLPKAADKSKESQGHDEPKKADEEEP